VQNSGISKVRIVAADPIKIINQNYQIIISMCILTDSTWKGYNYLCKWKIFPER
jgi:hypothetical protein